jgi:hypothetical protein
MPADNGIGYLRTAYGAMQSFKKKCAQPAAA